MAEKKYYCLLEERNGTRMIASISLLRVKKNNKWVKPVLSDLQDPVTIDVHIMKDGKRKAVERTIAVGTLDDLRNRRSNVGKRLPLAKRHSFSPIEKLTKKAAKELVRRELVKSHAAQKRSLALAVKRNQIEADNAYDTIRTGTPCSEVPSESTSPPPALDSSGETLVVTPTCRVSTPRSSGTGDVRRPMPRSLTIDDIGEEITRPHKRNVRRVKASTPLTAVTREPQDALEPGVGDNLTRGLVARVTDDIATVDPTDQVQFNKAVVKALLSLRRDTELVKKYVTGAEKQGPASTISSDASLHVDSSSKPKKEFVPDDDGNVELLPGFICRYDKLSPALLAKTTRRRANEVMRLIWSDKQILWLRVGKFTPTKADDSRCGFARRRQNLISAVTVTDYKKIMDICSSMQLINPLPNDSCEHKVDINLRSWASDWLKNQRMMIKRRTKAAIRCSPASSPKLVRRSELSKETDHSR